MPKCEYPAYFDGGLLGIKCKEDIKHRDVYIYIPYKMLLSIKSTQEHAVLGEIVKAHPECFSAEKNDDHE